MAQMFEKVKPDFSRDKSNYMPKGIAYAILTGDVEMAADILRLFDCDVLYGEKMMTNRAGIASFYGLSEEYVRNMMLRYGITSSATPNHCVAMNGSQFAGYTKLKYHYDKDHKENCGHILPDGRLVQFNILQECYYDSRVVLAFSCLAFIGRKVIPDSNADKIMQALRKTRYYDIAKKAFEEYEASQSAQKTQAETTVDAVHNDDHTEVAQVTQGVPAAFVDGMYSEHGTAYVPVAIIPEIIKAIIPFIVK